MFIFERAHTCTVACTEGQRERERESQAGSELSVQSPMWDLNPQKIKTWTKIKSQTFKRLSHPGTPRVRLLKRQNWQTLSTIKGLKTIHERGKTTTDTAGIQSIMRDYYQHLYTNKLDNLEEMGMLLETQYLPRLTHDGIANLNRVVQTLNQFSKITQPSKNHNQMASQVNSTKHLKK